MVLGRFLGTFIGIGLAVLFPSKDPITQIILIFGFTLVGTGIGMLGSIFLGPSISTNRPYPQDSLDYWVNKYGEEDGKLAYKYWLEEI